MAPVLCSSVNSKASLLGMGWWVYAIWYTTLFDNCSTNAFVIAMTFSMHFQTLWTFQTRTITSIVSLIALITAAVMSALTHSYYKRLASSDYYNKADYDDNDGGNNGDAEEEMYTKMASIGSFSVVFAGLYTMILAGVLSCFGGAYVVGFVAPNGRYFAPFFTLNDTGAVNPKYLGMFLGSLVLFSNVCLVTAVVLGEFQVSASFLCRALSSRVPLLWEFYSSISIIFFQ
jgi:hypothetical protein